MKRNFGFRELWKQHIFLRMSPFVVISMILSLLVSDCLSVSSDQGGYFLFTPPFGGNYPSQEYLIDKRSGGDKDITPAARASITPAETLWVGSHKINWNPLPIFQRIIDHHEHKQQQRLAQARTFDLQDQPEPLIQNGPFSFGGGSFKNSFVPQANPKKSLFQNPHHDFSNKITSGGFFAGLNAAAFGKPDAPKVKPPNFAESRSSVQPDVEYSLTQPRRSQPTTPLPAIQLSTGGTMLVSPPGTIVALSTPGPSISPIVDRLRKMTQWSKQTQKSGTIMPQQKESKSISPLERRRRFKKRLRNKQAKEHKHNIEAIILSKDNDDSNEFLPSDRHIRIVKSHSQTGEKRRKSKSSKRRRKSRDRKVSQEQNDSNSSGSSEEIIRGRAAHQRSRGDIVIIHPTNAAFLNDPMDGQQSLRRNYQFSQVRRKDKGLFQTEDAMVHKPAPTSFRFGAEDARVNPYLHIN